MKTIKKISVIFFVAVFLVGLPAGVLALDKQSEQAVYVISNQIIEGNFIKFGNIIDIAGAVNGDVIVAGNSINISGPVAGDIIAAGNMVKISGSVGGSIRIMAGSIEISGPVERNAWVMGSTVVLSADSKIGWDLYGAAGSIEVKGPIGRNIWAGTGTLVISSDVGKDVSVSIDKEGQVILNPEAKINGNLTYKAAEESQLVSKDGAQVLGATSLKNLSNIATSRSKDFSRALNGANLFFKIIVLFGLLVIGIVIVTLVPKLALKFNDQMVKKPWPSLGFGLVYFLLTPLVVLLLFITVIGIPLALIIIPIYFISLYVAEVLAGFSVGLFIFDKAFKGKYKASLIWPLIVGLIIFVAIASIPIVGWAIKLLAIFWALGAVIQVKQEIIKEYR